MTNALSLTWAATVTYSFLYQSWLLLAASIPCLPQLLALHIAS